MAMFFEDTSKMVTSSDDEEKRKKEKECPLVAADPMSVPPFRPNGEVDSNWVHPELLRLRQNVMSPLASGSFSIPKPAVSPPVSPVPASTMPPPPPYVAPPPGTPFGGPSPVTAKSSLQSLSAFFAQNEQTLRSRGLPDPARKRMEESVALKKEQVDADSLQRCWVTDEQKQWVEKLIDEAGSEGTDLSAPPPPRLSLRTCAELAGALPSKSRSQEYRQFLERYAPCLRLSGQGLLFSGPLKALRTAPLKAQGCVLEEVTKGQHIGNPLLVKGGALCRNAKCHFAHINPFGHVLMKLAFLLSPFRRLSGEYGPFQQFVESVEKRVIRIADYAKKERDPIKHLTIIVMHIFLETTRLILLKGWHCADFSQFQVREFRPRSVGAEEQGLQSRGTVVAALEVEEIRQQLGHLALASRDGGEQRCEDTYGMCLLLARYPNKPGVWELAAECADRSGIQGAARWTLANGLQFFPDNEELWRRYLLVLAQEPDVAVYEKEAHRAINALSRAVYQQCVVSIAENEKPKGTLRTVIPVLIVSAALHITESRQDPKAGIAFLSQYTNAGQLPISLVAQYNICILRLALSFPIPPPLNETLRSFEKVLYQIEMSPLEMTWEASMPFIDEVFLAEDVHRNVTKFHRDLAQWIAAVVNARPNEQLYEDITQSFASTTAVLNAYLSRPDTPGGCLLTDQPLITHIALLLEDCTSAVAPKLWVDLVNILCTWDLDLLKTTGVKKTMRLANSMLFSKASGPNLWRVFIQHFAFDTAEVVLSKSYFCVRERDREIDDDAFFEILGQGIDDPEGVTAMTGASPSELRERARRSIDREILQLYDGHTLVDLQDVADMLIDTFEPHFRRLLPYSFMRIMLDEFVRMTIGVVPGENRELKASEAVVQMIADEMSLLQGRVALAKRWYPRWSCPRCPDLPCAAADILGVVVRFRGEELPEKARIFFEEVPVTRTGT